MTVRNFDDSATECRRQRGDVDGACCLTGPYTCFVCQYIQASATTPTIRPPADAADTIRQRAAMGALSSFGQDQKRS
jgi:hypothetical protein